jgi:hypothetical protein
MTLAPSTYVETRPTSELVAERFEYPSERE